MNEEYMKLESFNFRARVLAIQGSFRRTNLVIRHMAKAKKYNDD